MPSLPGVNHLDAVRALEKAGFWILRQGKHVVMTDGTHKVSIPRHNPVNAYSMGGIVHSAGLTIDEFRRLLCPRFSALTARDMLIGCIAVPATTPAARPQGGDAMAVRPIPEGYHTVTPYLIVKDAAAAIEFYKKAFGASELMRM